MPVGRVARSVSGKMAAMSPSTNEMTIDQLAARVGMTVRNVRAYASRGLIAPPRLVGRTGYYTLEHVNRLQLVRDLLDRGYTLNAVEKALENSPEVSDSHALDLLNLLSHPLAQPQEPEEISVDALARMAAVDRDEEQGLLDELEELGVLVRIDEETVKLLHPALVRSGAQALALGLSRPTVLGMLGRINSAMDSVAESFVGAFRDEVWGPFRKAGMPEEEWPRILKSIEALLPVASQAVVASFRDRLAAAIESALGEEITSLSGDELAAINGEHLDQIFGPDRDSS
jgi:DNA-binding transcriptional MerR regulator